jgi:transcriptional regulator with PAS, ATPase and Fis domain
MEQITKHEQRQTFEDRRDTIRLQLSGSALTELMRRRNTNKYRIAKATKIGYQTLYRWERQKGVPTKKRQVVAIGEFLGLDINFLK